MDHDITIALPRSEADILRRTAMGLGITPEELAKKLLTDEITQRCGVAVSSARVFDFRGPISGLDGGDKS